MKQVGDFTLDRVMCNFPGVQSGFILHPLIHTYEKAVVKSKSSVNCPPGAPWPVGDNGKVMVHLVYLYSSGRNVPVSENVMLMGS